jgi:oxygen-independent coproporphyrinogen-3 oxidase
VKHPAAYAERLAAGSSPALGREVLDDETRRTERILLETRLVEGLPTSVLHQDGRSWLPDLRDAGLVSAETDRVVLTRKGRLLADAVVRDLVS